jgi:hypothetical protein
MPMWMPVIRGVIERRLLVNLRVDLEVLGRVVPRPFRPQAIRGYGLAGICLIRLGGVRPRGLPAWMGIGSENAAHRVAVEWDEGGRTRQGVYIWRRDTNSRLNAAAGGRVFPGVHHLSRFSVRESGGRFEVEVCGSDERFSVHVAAREAATWPQDSVFGSLEEASALFKAGSVGYSPGCGCGNYDGLALVCDSWMVRPLAIERAASSVFQDEAVFPPGSMELDCGLVMQNVAHEWWAEPTLRYAAADSDSMEDKEAMVSA